METQKLIKLVRERRLLYDSTDIDYKNHEDKAEGWQELAREMEMKYMVSGKICFVFVHFKFYRDYFLIIDWNKEQTFLELHSMHTL